MGHIIESAENDILSTTSDNQELVPEESVEDNDVHQVSLNKWPPSPEIDRCIANIYDPPLDGNCLFNSFIHFFCGLDNVDNYEMTCSTLREKAMCHLLDHRDHRTHSHTFEELLDWQLPDVRAHERDKRKNPTQEQRKLFGKIPKLSSIKDYAETMKDGTPHKCIWGSILEIYVISNLYSLNVAVYSERTRGGNTFNLIDSVFVGPEAPTIYLLHTNGGTHFNRICRVQQDHLQQPKPTSVSENCSQFLCQLKSELNGMRLKDLRSLYNNVLLALPDQNGYVVDHNKLLAALMGSNTNSLFLGSREQSKGALFYIGPYINKK